MTIIELLNKIANGEGVPNKIKYLGKEYIYDFNIQDYRCNDTLLFNTLFSKYRTAYFINDEVEIIEEDKEIEKITINDNGTIGFPNGQWTARNMDIAFAIKINKIIDKVNSLEKEQ